MANKGHVHYKHFFLTATLLPEHGILRHDSPLVELSGQVFSPMSGRGIGAGPRVSLCATAASHRA